MKNRQRATQIALTIKRKIDNDEELTEDEEELLTSHWGGFSVKLGKAAAERHEQHFTDFIEMRLNNEGVKDE